MLLSVVSSYILSSSQPSCDNLVSEVGCISLITLPDLVLAYFLRLTITDSAFSKLLVLTKGECGENFVCRCQRVDAVITVYILSIFLSLFIHAHESLTDTDGCTNTCRYFQRQLRPGFVRFIRLPFARCNRVICIFWFIFAGRCAL